MSVPSKAVRGSTTGVQDGARRTGSPLPLVFASHTTWFAPCRSYPNGLAVVACQPESSLDSEMDHQKPSNGSQNEQTNVQLKAIIPTNTQAQGSENVLHLRCARVVLQILHPTKLRSNWDLSAPQHLPSQVWASWTPVAHMPPLPGRTQRRCKPSRTKTGQYIGERMMGGCVGPSSYQDLL